MLKKLKLRIVLLIFVAILVQVSVVPFFRINRIGPDLFFMVFLLLAMKVSKRYILFFALVFGCLKELFVNHYFGNELIPYLVMGLFVPLIINRFNCENKIIRYLIIFCCSFFMSGFSLICISLSEYSTVILQNFFQKTIYTSVYTTVVAFFLSPVVDLYLPKKSIQYELF